MGTHVPPRHLFLKGTTDYGTASDYNNHFLSAKNMTSTTNGYWPCIAAVGCSTVPYFSKANDSSKKPVATHAKEVFHSRIYQKNFNIFPPNSFLLIFFSSFFFFFSRRKDAYRPIFARSVRDWD